MTQNQLIYICGSGHSGSTMLDMILGGHPLISSIGEGHRIYMSANNASQAHACTCGRSLRTCPFWIAVDAEVRRMLNSGRKYILDTLPTTDPRHLTTPQSASGLDIAETVPQIFNPTLNRFLMVLGSRRLAQTSALISPSVRMHLELMHNSAIIYDAIRRAHGTPIILDSTKTPSRLKGLYLELRGSPVHFRALYLIRDGRAVCHSRMRRQHLDMQTCANIWKSEHQKLHLALLTVPAKVVTRVSYESICLHPERTIRTLCATFGLEFTPSMLEFRSGERHNLGGNTMRWRSKEVNIRLDEKWRTSLSKSDLRTFDAIAGSTNGRLGYGQ